MNKVKGSDKLPTKHSAFLQVSSDLRENDKVLSWFEQLYQAAIPKTVWLQCELALAEGFTNAARHAHRDLSRETLIDIEVTIFSDHTEIRIWDCGPPFDLEEWLKAQPAQTDMFAPGGRGIKLMYAIADNISYTRSTSENRNCLLISKDYWPYPKEQNQTSDSNS
ncbi:MULTISPECIES: ATP-binding protein [Okeania]|uniref:ATP-binding protein n=1 Tax=Okeania hirsuta TaxID=1458930 RepID=A0A3N6PE93_9CYAN|nr:MULTISPECIES: ATP-binding protein [Okeania]NEP06033.1 ATP-binding protein [Okeania sp. SIO4D6]NET15487.1 ATP-binding protein [Okeania sp. SIO1H6]NEP75077.1 ATP-binding protein [Okeania sp. SIO2G5]NEP95681.1 ATP-binding protein [Okeania sp. SIO2F5]NEQ93393.1 ATP-binding protein [Okeania sp. SIO2G4]